MHSERLHALRLPAALCACLALTPAALAQGHGNNGNGGGNNRGGGNPSGISLGAVSQFRGHSTEAPSITAKVSEPRSAGLHLVPSGRWWDDDHMVQTVGLNAAQQKRMDDIFSDNREHLLSLYKNLDVELNALDRLGRARKLDETQIYAQIDRVNQVRSELEKAIAHYQMQLRKEMTSDQTARMDGLRPDVPVIAEPLPASQPFTPPQP